MPAEENERQPLHRGLQKVYLDRTTTTFIEGAEGILEYRGYSIHDLAEQSTFEETAYLILKGELPTQTQLDDFDRQLKEARHLPEEILGIIRIVKDAHPMDVLRTAVSALSAFEPERDDHSLEAVYRKGVRLTSQIACIVMAHYNIRNGREPVHPNPEISHAANFLYMMEGKTPSEQAVRFMDKDFVLHADHGLNASAFTARVVTGTSADLHASITAAIAALSGPSHGGAAENVMTMVQEIGTPEKAKDYVTNLVQSRKRVMGFGHRVYKSEDPRARHLKEGVRQLSEETGQMRWFRVLENIQDAMSPYARKGIHVNVDFFAGVIYHLLGIKSDLFVPIFAVGRVPGWTIQVMEQLDSNILIRPLLRYEGEREKVYISIEERR